MIKKISLSFALLAVFSVPLYTHALTEKDLQGRIDELLKQLTALQEKLIALQNPPQSKIPVELPAGGSDKLAACEYISSALQRGSTDAATGGDVTKLQRFLANLYRLDIRDIVTGFFGTVTEGHVARFQRENGLPEVGSVGPLTRAHIARMCGIEEPHACIFVSYQRPVCNTGEHVEARIDAFGCQAAPVCVPDTKTDIGDKGKSAAPVISGVSGPTALGIGQTGTWTVGATDSSGGALSYSVQWGDTGALGELTKIAGASFDTFVQSATFSHAYGRAGVFTPRFTVRSASGMAAVTSISVNVGAASPSTGTFSASPISGIAPLMVRFNYAHPSPYTSAPGYRINFGDGQAGYPGMLCTMYAGGTDECSSDLTATHTYTAPGTYTAELYSVSCRDGGSTGSACPQTYIASVTVTVVSATLYDGAGSGYYGPQDKSYIYDATKSGYYGTDSGRTAACPPLYEKLGGTCAAF